jgi:hypothetical protein
VTYFQYEAIYLGIIVGLALANILTSFHKLIDAGPRVHWHWLAPAVALYASLLTLGEFWSVWERQNSTGHRMFFTWLPLAFAFAILFLFCAASLPDDVSEDRLDLKDYYFSNRKRIWGFSMAVHLLNLTSWTISAVDHGHAVQYLLQNWHPYFGNLVEAGLSLAAMFTRSEWLQAAILLAMAAYMISLFGPMSLN